MIASSISPAAPLPSNDPAAAAYLRTHAKRFDLSLQWLMPFLGPEKRVLELGGPSPFAERIEATGAECLSTRQDLRYLELKSRWDVILCMEVIEHIGDTDGLHTEWHGDGVKRMLEEACHALRPDGVFFLTTPNCSSITGILRLLLQQPPMLYRPHVREYVPYELDELVRAAGFRIERRETIDVWLNSIDPTQYKIISDFLYTYGFSVQLRGEDIFLLARKPPGH